MLKAVYDTNIIVSAVLHKDRLPASLLSLALEGKEVRLFVSKELLKEYEEILKRPKFKLDGKDIEDLMKLIKRKSIKVKPTKKLTVIKKDLADNRILGCALEAEADFIVTGNKKHFPFDKFHGVKVVNPQEFATHFMTNR